VHPFWSSHKEKRACVRLSMGGQPWPKLKLHGRPWELTGEEGGEGGRGLQEGAPWGLGPAAPFGHLRSVHERRREGEEKKEKRKKKRRKKRKKM
jgi:hypothetical protein